ncbi:hypothetical protein [Actinacidiphila epipremni]|jgi:hypothetical protein|uniref:SPOR domain-containing protein n=1 Tax=Actinacidiphila epipremni TaxID=2053013 RepID=A0ABX0ZLW4_9ACTN|nr:hypothetical protein [Actinacidiphila epipremni]NJP42643.1 hypothetical protein [Actinacidiphila epipremni]
MTQHWHAYTYTGPGRPRDADARDPAVAAPPLVIAEWPDKPRSMLVGQFADREAAASWLEQEVARTPPMPTALPAESLVAYARTRLAQDPADVVTRYYTASSYVCRDLVLCTGRCPASPAE